MGRQANVRALANFLGLDPDVVAEGLVEAARRDRGLRACAVPRRAAA
ncbi:MAG TPA: hypothetical protein VME01_05620 [Solirubrobacteraceae bacterium]|nr:hypothetical protein [Solirubrobacteraceae bacterium]